PSFCAEHGTMTTSTSSVTSIASSSGSGAAGGSVIDVNTLVSELVSATRTPQDTLISNQQSAVTSQISAVASLKSALSTFQTSFRALDTQSASDAETATSSNTSAFTATATSGAVNGTYSVGVSQLAQAQQIVSNAFSGGSSASVGTGTLKISLGGASF